jgi:hypothetical protein
MSTRNMTLVIDRKYAQDFKEGFALKPHLVSKKSNVHMYMHHDGYPEWRGIELANWIKFMQETKRFCFDGSRIAANLVHDFHYDSQYLYNNVDDIDHEYTWIIWTGKPDIWLSAYNQYTSTCEFVGTPDKLINRYKQRNMDYTDWSKEYKMAKTTTLPFNLYSYLNVK